MTLRGTVISIFDIETNADSFLDELGEQFSAYMKLLRVMTPEEVGLAIDATPIPPTSAGDPAGQPEVQS